MNKERFYFWIIVCMLAINGILIFYLLHSKKTEHDSPRGENRNRNIIIEKLRFDSTQILAYDSLIFDHRQEMHVLKDQLNSLRTELYINIEKKDSLSSKKLIDSISIYQTKLEWVHFHHFQDIKKLCKSSQLQSFAELEKELADMFNHRLHRKSKHL